MKNLLLVEDLWASYGEHMVLKGVNFALERGEKVVIVGPSGSGKSTLLKCIVRLVEPIKGKIFLDGVEVTSPKTDIRSVRAKTGFVFQNYNLFPHMTVLENIALPLRIVKKLTKRDAEEKAKIMLKTVGMDAYMDKYPLQLSGGQQQRVAIARALAMDPILLLLDEPTSALDPELRGEVLDVLRRIAREGISMLIVTHEMDFAEEVADRMLFMEDGKILAADSPSKLIHSLENERLVRFFGKLKA